VDVQLVLTACTQLIYSETYCCAGQRGAGCRFQDLARLPGGVEVIRGIRAAGLGTFDASYGACRDQEKVCATLAIVQHRVALRVWARTQ
jgi:hypothetical protein